MLVLSFNYVVMGEFRFFRLSCVCHAILLYSCIFLHVMGICSVRGHKVCHQVSFDVTPSNVKEIWSMGNSGAK